MYSLIRLNTLASCVLLCLALLPRAQAAPDIVPPPDGCYPGFTTAEGCQALRSQTSNASGNTALGWRALYSVTDGSFNVGVGAGALVLDRADANTAVGTAALLLNRFGARNTALGAAAMVYTDGTADGNGSFNGAVGAFALNSNVTGFSNNAVGNSALFFNINAAQNTAIGDLALDSNDADGAGLANNNTAVGASSLTANFSGSENTAVGTGVGPNIVTGFNNTYVGNFIDPGVDESSTIRINDLSGGNAQECFIGGIFNNFQPVNGTNIVEVTLNLDNDELGWDVGPNQSAPSVPSRGAPVRRGSPQPRERPQLQHQAMLNGKVEKLQATVAQQQKQIEILRAQLKEHTAQIQKVSAQLEVSKPGPETVASN